MKNIKSVQVVHTIQDGDDWEAIYINGKIVKQGANMTAADLLEFLKEGDYMALPTIDQHWVDEEWMDQLPATFNDIPKDVICREELDFNGK
ncbi:hypothetical protein HQ584_03390 [Patescibacteria group bacterium]|nr:hypothetical protein [Patescibacteria group bacterium]